MNPDEYNKIAVNLTEQLNQKGTLIDFVVCDTAAYTFGRKRPVDTALLSHFAIEWRIPFKKWALAGSYLFPVEAVIDAPEVDIAKIIIEMIMPEISHAITHPDEVTRAATR